MAKLTVFHNDAEIQQIDLFEDQEYIGGRAKDADIPLEADHKMSRQHFRLFHDGQNWQVEILSRYGELVFEGNPTQNAHLIGDCKFSISPYEFHLKPVKISRPSEPEYDEDGSMLPALGNESSLMGDNMGDDEVTAGGQVDGIPFIRIVDGDGNNLQTLRLEGNFWSAGRDSTAAIHINDMRVSRSQFQVLGTPEGYFIKDLGSVNGTLLNGSPLKPNTPQALTSGDVISVLDTYLYFEIRDPQFNNKMMNIDPRVAPPVMMNQQVQMQNYLATMDPTGQYGGHQPPAQPEDVGPYELQIGDFKDGSWKKKMKNLDKKSKFRVVIAIALAFMLVLGVMPDGAPKKKVDNEITDPFLKLSPEDQEFVKRTYVLAKNLYMQGKYELASGEIAKIHQKIDYYEDSVQIQEYASEAIKIRQEKERIEKERQERLQLEEEARSIIAGCQKFFDDEDNIDVDELSACLSPARDRVGIEAESHPLAAEILDMIERAKGIIEERQRKEAEQADYRRRAGIGRSLFTKAEKLREKGLPHKAIAQYRKHIKARYPDPKGLKKVSKRRIASIQDIVQQEADKFLQKADEYYEQQDLRAAVLEIDKALRLKRVDDELVVKRKKIINELRKRMQILYQESILEESLGNIESAKDRWFKIRELDIPNGEYHKKSSIKLKKYGGL